MRKKPLLTTLLLLCSGLSFGAAYQLNLQGLRQLAMGGTGTALPQDATTIFYNPGGLSRLDNVEINGSVLFIMPRVEYAQTPTGNYTTTSQSQTFVPFNLYFGGPLSKGSKWALGLGVYTPFGSGLTWDNDWTGRYMVQSIYLESIFFQPTVSYRINDVVSVGGGIIYAYGNLDLKQAIPIQNEQGMDGQVDLNGNAHGWGYNLGVQLKASDRLQFGVTYRSQINMHLNNGDANFTVPASVATEFPNQNFKTELPLPQVASIGVAYKPTHKLLLQLDVNFVGWSAYDSLKFDFNNPTAEVQNNHSPRLYQNTVDYRIGAAYDFSRKLCGMIGAAWDPTPVRDGFVSPELPDANRTVLTCGITYKPISRLAIMAAFEYTTSAKRDASYNFDNFTGEYQTKGATPGIGINYAF